MIENLYWELTVLSKAVGFKNLTSASDSIGISQPQLSRIVAKIERELEIVLLDRAMRRKSGWTPAAMRLAETFSRFSRELGSALHGMTHEQEPRTLRIGTLEGLSEIASQLGHEILTQSSVHFIELDIYDLQELEEKFLRGEFDLIFTLREPGRKRYGYSRILGYQQMREAGGRADLRVLSPYEYGALQSDDPLSQKLFVSNSLALRKEWIEEFGGSGTLPSPLQVKFSDRKDIQPVLLIGQDLLSPRFWKLIRQLGARSV